MKKFNIKSKFSNCKISLMFKKINLKQKIKTIRFKISDFFTSSFRGNKKIFSKILSSKILSNRKILKSFLTFIIILVLLTNSFAWLYDEYIGNGAQLTMGRISHSVIQYDEDGNILSSNDDTQTLIYETNMSNITRGSKYIEIENTGTLNMEFSLAFSLEGTIETAGIMYYRLYEVTDQVNSMTTDSINDTKLKAYAAANPLTASVETDTSIPISNMSTMNNLIKIDTINKDNDGSNSKYYRLDYGVYQTVNTSLYSGDSFSLHMNAYSSQEGVITAENRSGQTWNVQTESQFREILMSAVAGDTIKLTDDITIEGTVDIAKRINLDTNDHILKITGDLLYEFVSLGEYMIDVSGNGRLTIANDFIINTPKAQMIITGENKSYDMVVAGTMSINTLQDGEIDGAFLENVRIVKSVSSLIPIDLTVLSNTRLTIGPDVDVGMINAKEGSTNIEVINNGNVAQMNFSAMSLLDTFTKAQIYVYNLGQIYGVLDQAGIILPADATPYLGANNGNTLIIKGITSGDVLVSGSDSFSNSDISTNEDDITVLPIEDELNSYIVYIKESTVSVESLLTDYFNIKKMNVEESLASIERLTIYTVNAQYMENEDFDFIKSSALASIEYLNLKNARIKDNNVVNRIKNYALYNKSTLRTLVLPSSISEIGDYAFYNIGLGYIPADMEETFNMLEIPSTITSIGSYAFNKAKYVSIKSVIPPQIGANAFADNAKIFVIDGTISTYQQTANLVESNIYRQASLSDDRRYFVYDTDEGVGISYIINNYLSADTLGIPSVITYQGSNKNVTALGTNSYREMNITNTSGVPVLLPSTVTRIESYALYNLNITSIALDNVTYIGDYAFYNTSLTSVIADKVTEIGIHAFELSTLSTLSLKNVNKINAYAFASAPNLYEANVGAANYLGPYAFYNCKHMAKFYFENTNTEVVNNKETIKIEIGENAVFSNWGYYIDNRLRVYVPDGISSNNTEYVDLYKNLFDGNERYIYIKGIEYNDYTYMSVPAELNEYTVRQISLTNKAGTISVGWEIISYQGDDLSSSYQVPSSLTIGSKTYPVISIGSYAYGNTSTVDSESIVLSNNYLININDYAFYNLAISSVKANSALLVGDYAFSNTNIQIAEFKSLKTIGSYALADISSLVSLNLGPINNIGTNAVSNDSNLEQLYITNTNKTITLNGEPFSNIGTNASSRLRIYVPYDQLSYYKELLSTYSDFVYATGYLKGSFINSPINYDIGEYSVREVTIDYASGQSLTGWEIVEYHGADLNSDYTIPTELSVADNRLSASLSRRSEGWGSSSSGWITTYDVYVTNVGSETVNSWEIVIPTDGWELLTVNAAATGTTWSLNDDGDIVMTCASYNSTIEQDRTVTMSFQLKWTGDRSTDVTKVTARESSTYDNTYPVISIGDGAYKHTTSLSGTNIVLDNEQILKVGDYAFTNLNGISQVTFKNVETIGTNAFDGSSITIGTFDNVKSVGDYAFSNVSSLYKLDLGIVSSLGRSSISNAPYLYQMFFDVKSNDLDLSFANDAITNVGSSTEDRMRIYVTSGSNDSGERYVDIYKNKFNTNYQSYFFSYDYLMGSYIPTGISETLDIGEYTLREVSYKNIDNNTIDGYELVEYHGSDITRDYEFPSALSLSDSKLTATSSVTSSWGSYGYMTTQIRVDITNNGSAPVGTWKVVLDVSSGGTVSSATTWNNTATIDGDRLTITNVSNNGTINAGETKSIALQISHTEVNLIPIVKTVKEDILGDDVVNVISAGDYSYMHAKTISSSYFDISSDNLLNIGLSAFEGNVGIRNVTANNVVSIGNNAFKNTSSFHYGSFSNLKEAGTYAFSNTSNLAYLNLGKIQEIKEGLLYGAVKMTQLYINNTAISANEGRMNFSIADNAFTNLGSIVGNRLRIYVPSGSISDVKYVDAYKASLPVGLKDYIYETGTIVGTYYFNEAGLDIGEYSVINTSVNGTDGWKIVEYHGENITSDYVLPSDPLTIGEDTYSVIAIGDHAYYNINIDSSTEWNLEIPDPMRYIGAYAFYKKPIKTLTGNLLSYVGPYAFAENNQLISVVFTTITKISDHAFYRNTSLNTVNFGEGIEEIEDFAFYNSWAENNLKTFYINTVTPPTIYENTLPSIYWDDTDPDPTVYVPYASISDYNEASYWQNYTIESIGSIYNNAFIYRIINDDEIEITNYINTRSTTVSIPDYFIIGWNYYKVTAITATAFDGASRLTTLRIPAYVNNIGNGFLENNKSIRTITVSSSNRYFTSVNGVLFDDDRDTLIRFPSVHTTTSYNVPSGTKVIAARAFCNATSLKRINLNSDLLVIDDTAFDGATNLKTLSFSSSTPPYVTGFNPFNIVSGLKIMYPYYYENAYKNNVYYSWYLDYLVAN